MATVQTFNAYDCSTLANFKDWPQALGSALSTLGWVKATDTSPASMVDWTHVVDVPANNVVATTGWRFDGNWSSGNFYTPSGGNDHVMYDPGTGAVCYQNVNRNNGTLSKATRQTSQSFVPTSVANHSGSTTVYTCSGGVSGGGSNAYVNWYFTVSGCNLSSNNGTFLCTASSTTTINLYNPNGTLETPSGSPTIVSSANTTFYTWGTTIPGFNGGANPAVDNELVGQSFHIAGFANSGNNGTFTCIASGIPGSSVFTVTNSSGVNETLSATIVCLTDPQTSSYKATPQWTPYYYEIWKSADSLSSTNPIYLRLVYRSENNAVNGNSDPRPSIFFSVGTRVSSGFLGGNVLNGASNPIEQELRGSATANVPSSTFECDFSGNAGNFSMIMFRDKLNAPMILVIDRAKDSSGSDLDTYFSVLSVSGTFAARQQALFKQGAGTRCPNSIDTVWNTINGTQSSYAQNGLVPAFPIFPIVGYLGNPLLQAACMRLNDISSDGELININTYGTAHTYMVSTNVSTTVGGSYIYPCILWE